MMRHVAVAALLLASTTSSFAADALREGFANPPQSARPRVWWHWLGGNITKDGIAEDLDWMKRVGIGGVQNFDADLGTPQVVARRLAYMTPEWKDAFRFAATRAEANGLELAIAASPGWSETGGPWVTPADAMKKLTWSETVVPGGVRFRGALPAPSRTTGSYQEIGLGDPMNPAAGARAPKFGADIAVLAYPIVVQPQLPAPLVSAGGVTLVGAALDDANLESSLEVPKGTANRPGDLTLVYPAPVTVRSARIFVPHAKPPFGNPAYRPLLEAEVDGGWRKVADLPLDAVPTTVSFAPITARRFRLVLVPNRESATDLGAPAPGALMVNVFGDAKPSTTLPIGEFRLMSEPRVDRGEAKAGFNILTDYLALPDVADEARGPASSDVIDLTSRVSPDGRLDWTPPAGTWRIVRFGMSLLGTTNHPATPEATGLEVDKYDPAAVRRYLETYLGHYHDAAGKALIGAHGVRALLNDSTEVGPSNWTPAMLARFKALRGYDATPWLPALTGALIGTRADSDRFLYDYRRTLADLMASEHYGTIAAVARDHGLATYGEALEDGRPVLGDDLAMRKYVDVPMAAMWSFPADGSPRPTLLGDMKGAASVANLYGRKFVAAESMTAAFSPWAFAPADLKHIIDLEFVSGINRPVIHTSVHSPMDDKEPGLSLAIFGQYFNRHETWAAMARPWIDYIARTSFVLQQGRSVTDVAYFSGEDAPITAQYLYGEPAGLPTRNGFDFVNADVLANLLTVQGGDLVAPSGARYRLLFLGGSSDRMTLPTLRRIAALTESGATIVGERPTSSPSLADSPAEYAALVARLWSGAAITGVGKGRIIATRDVAAGLAAAKVEPDAILTSPGSDVRFLHRRLADGDAYFIDNRRNRLEQIEASFRISGKAPELWHADTGTVEPLSYRIAGGRTIVPLKLDPVGSALIVFRQRTTRPSRIVAPPRFTPLATLGSGWDVSFQPGRGAPGSTRLATLASLSDNKDPGIRYFSGTATYSTRFDRPAGASRAPLWIDLGQIGDVAEVRINRILAGTVWHAPYRLDISRLTKPGTNRLEIKVANLWVNRLIGDAQPGAVKIAFVAAPTYRADAPLRPSGLIGPVILLGERRAQ